GKESLPYEKTNIIKADKCIDFRGKITNRCITASGCLASCSSIPCSNRIIDCLVGISDGSWTCSRNIRSNIDRSSWGGSFHNTTRTRKRKEKCTTYSESSWYRL